MMAERSRFAIMGSMRPRLLLLSRGIEPPIEELEELSACFCWFLDNPGVLLRGERGFFKMSCFSPRAAFSS